MKFKDLWIKPTVETKGAAGEAQGAPPTSPSLPQNQATEKEGEPGPFLEQLEDALEKANLPSQQDYLDFAKALKNMESLPMDEATKFKAAFATLQSIGCDVNQLLESFDYYEGILDGEKDKFNEALHATIGETVAKKEKDLKQLSEENMESSAEIQKLTEQINANQGSIARLQNELSEVNSKLKRQENNFAAAYSIMKQRLQSDAQKIRTYLGPMIAGASPKPSKKK